MNLLIGHLYFFSSLPLFDEIILSKSQRIIHSIYFLDFFCFKELTIKIRNAFQFSRIQM